MDPIEYICRDLRSVVEFISFLNGQCEDESAFSDEIHIFDCDTLKSPDSGASTSFFFCQNTV